MNKKVMFFAPFPEDGRFAGGIYVIAKEVRNNVNYANGKDIDIEFFNTEVMNRDKKSMGKFSLDNLYNVVRLKKAIKNKLTETRVDIIHYHTSVKLALLKDLIMIKSLKKYFTGKVVLHVHFAETKKILLNNIVIDKYVINTINKYVDKLILLSTATKKEFEKLGILSEKMEVVYNFHAINVDIATIENKIEKNSQESDKKTNIVFLGSIDKRKGIIDLLKVLVNIDSRKYTLHICGVLNDESIKDEFNLLINRIQDNVNLHGYVSGKEKKDILENSDVLVLPSYGEGMPLSILEGMATGCAVIATDVGGVKEIIKNNKNGFIFNPGNIEELKTLIEKLIENKFLLTEFMKKNYIDSKKYSIESFLNEVISIYNRA